jgi:hypothetical protein
VGFVINKTIWAVNISWLLGSATGFSLQSFYPQRPGKKYFRYNPAQGQLWVLLFSRTALCCYLKTVLPLCSRICRGSVFIFACVAHAKIKIPKPEVAGTNVAFKTYA